MTVFPSVVAIFAFMFTSWPYFLGALLVVCSMWITEKWKYGWAPGILLAVVGLGAYQAWLFLWISIVLLLCMKKCVDSEVALRQMLLYIIKHICLFVIILAGYLVLNKIELARYDVELSSYQGISSVLSLSGLSIDVIFRGIVNSYKNFFFADISGLIEGKLITYLYYSVLVLSLIVMYTILTKIKKLGKKVIFTAIIFVLPLGFNGIWILGELGTLVSSLVCYSLVLVFVAPIIWMDWLDAGNYKEANGRRKRVHYVLCNLFTLLIAIVIAVYVYLDNVAYLEANLKTEQTRSWCIELITKIRGSDDYKDEYPVAFVTDGAIQDMSLTKMTDFKTTFSIYHWDMDLWLSMYTTKPFMKYFCGFNPDIAEEEDYLHLKGVIETMPVYPDDGSIDVIDGIVIVKLQDLE